MYNDPADADLVARVGAAAPAESAAHGATSPLAKLLAFQDRCGIARMLHQADWIAGRLCGRFDVTDENNALKTGYDPVARRWPDWIERTGARTGLLPHVVPPGTVLAPLTTEAARRLGLPASALVVAGTTDGCAAFAATGASEPGDGVTSLGSTLTIKLLSDRPVFAPRYGIYSHRIGDQWLAGGASNSGGAALARYFDAAAIARLSEAIDPARDSGLEYYPLPRPGERFPIADPALAPREQPRPADDARFLHGLLEGVARIEALAYARLAELGAPRLVRLRTVGGGARNAPWTAMRLRLTGAVAASARSEEAAVGAARFALAGLGITE
jgi:sugar (pentulose or hexulose) kinase